MITTVTGCRDCPFFNAYNALIRCSHPKGKNVYVSLDMDRYPDAIIPITPNDCPLKKEPITIKIK